jgi:hypothetical protein
MTDNTQAGMIIAQAMNRIFAFNSFQAHCKPSLNLSLDAKERFIIWAMDLFHLKDLRVFVVTTSGSPPSGTNKRQYAEEVWNIYKTICSKIKN